MGYRLASYDCAVAGAVGGGIIGGHWRFRHRGYFLHHWWNHHLLIPIRILQYGLGGIIAVAVVAAAVAVCIAAIVIIFRGLRLAHVIVRRWSGIAAQMGGHVVRRMRRKLIVGESCRIARQWIEGLWRRTRRLIAKKAVAATQVLVLLADLLHLVAVAGDVAAAVAVDVAVVIGSPSRSDGGGLVRRRLLLLLLLSVEMVMIQTAKRRIEEANWLIDGHK